MESQHRNPFRVREAIRFVVGYGLSKDPEYQQPEAIEIINKFYFLKEFGGAYTLSAIDEERNIDYLMLLRCMKAHNDRMERESKSEGSGSQYIDKEAIRQLG